ncbi:MAG: hypothetical protein H8E79_05650 [Desulfobulbaceae bacterium]|uniref:Uncharacterized protein n=1 Tax=Candidatus Desulfatifera sulfidica TaxID=2841691 RepID=A0A8J6N875_9BACT|nr:hypothetical protein [Candidatus Desulfatifera sulfidica]
MTEKSQGTAVGLNAGRLGQEADHSSALVELKLQVPEDLFRAYQRCTWIIAHETGRPPLSVMEEMVRDFLVKHGC